MHCTVNVKYNMNVVHSTKAMLLKHHELRTKADVNASDKCRAISWGIFNNVLWKNWIQNMQRTFKAMSLFAL